MLIAVAIEPFLNSFVDLVVLLQLLVGKPFLVVEQPSDLVAVVFFELSKYAYGIWKEREEEQAAIRRSAYRYRKVREEVKRQDRPWFL